MKSITNARTLQAQIVTRTRILLLKSNGESVDSIAENRNSVLLCLKKYSQGGIDNAIYDAPGRGRMQKLPMMKKHGLSILPVRNLLI